MDQDAGAVSPLLPSPVDELDDDRIKATGVRLLVKRDDLIHSEIPGNKWRKLKYNLATARRQGYSTLLTFGGAHSNHIRATAAAGHYFGFSTIGIIRGEENLPLNPSLAYAAARGMRLVYLDRETYRRKHGREVVAALRAEYGNFYLLPEGGSNVLAVRGCAELPAELALDFDVLCCPCGTGGTLAGISAGLPPRSAALGFSALKGGQFLDQDVRCLQERTYGVAYENWSIEYDFHFGGFAKAKPELHQFIADFQRRHDILLEWVYVAKMMYGVFSLIEQRRFAPGSVVVAVITGPAEPRTSSL